MTLAVEKAEHPEGHLRGRFHYAFDFTDVIVIPTQLDVCQVTTAIEKTWNPVRLRAGDVAITGGVSISLRHRGKRCLQTDLVFFASRLLVKERDDFMISEAEGKKSRKIPDDSDYANGG
jgi:hypothetical protein